MVDMELLKGLSVSLISLTQDFRRLIDELHLWCAAISAGARRSGSHESASPTRFFDGDATPPKSERRNSFLMKSGGSVNSSFSDTCGRPKSMPERRANTLKKRSSGLSDKKANPDFFRKLEGVRDSIDWQCGEVAVPRDSLQEGSPRAGVASSENLVYRGNCTDSVLGTAAPPPSVCGGETLEFISIKIGGEEVGQLNQPEENGEIACENIFFSFDFLYLDLLFKHHNIGRLCDTFVEL